MDKEFLHLWYVKERKSAHGIAAKLQCSEGKINYWLSKFGIAKRSISEAVYAYRNPNGDPFLSRAPQNKDEAFLFGLGIGLYWGEGTKKNLTAVRLGNTDPFLVRTFLLFLRRFYGIDNSRLRFAIQIFTDMDQKKEEKFWRDFLNVDAEQFYKTINTRSGSIGTYRVKSEHGVLTIYFNNKKLRDLLIGEIEKMKNLR